MKNENTLVKILKSEWKIIDENVIAKLICIILIP